MAGSGRTKRQSTAQLIGASLLIFFVALIVFSPAFSNNFTSWDDPAYVTDNPIIRSLGAESIGSMFSFETLRQFHHYIPLVLLSYAIEYKMVGLDPAVFHGTNVVLHALTAILVLWITFRLSRSMPLSLIVALLFAVHPMRVESVAWVTERKDMLSGLTFFGALLMYVLYVQKQKDIRFLAACGVFFILSLLSKAMAISLPLVLLLVDLLVGRTIDKRSIVEKIPFFALSMAFGIMALLSTQGNAIQQTVSGSVQYSEVERIFIASYGVLFYIFKFFVPVNISALYAIPTADSVGFPWYVYCSPLLVAGGIYALIKYRRSHPLLVFGGWFFLLTLGPVSQLVPVGVATIADRFTYIPYFGLMILVAGLLILFRDKILKPRNIPEMAGTVVVLAWVAILGFVTIGQTKVWNNDIQLWTSVIENPSPPAAAYFQRGAAFGAASRPRDAVADYTRAIQLDSSFALAWNNRGNVFGRMGNYDQAISDYNHAIAASPSYIDAYANRGQAFMLTKDFESALQTYDEILRIDPANARTYYYRGQAHFNLGAIDSAMSDYNKAIEIRPDYTEAYVRRGDVYFQLQKFKEAIADYTEGINRGASHELLFTNRGSSYANLGDFDSAIADFDRALAINPNYPDAILNRGVAYIGKKDYRIALVHFTMLEDMGQKQDPKIMKFLREQAAAQEKKER